MDVKKYPVVTAGLLILLLLVGCHSLNISQPQPASVYPTGPQPEPIPTTTRVIMPTLIPSAQPSLTPRLTPAPTFTLTPSITPTPAVVGVFGFSKEIDPLTGLEPDDPSLLQRRPVMVKISNAPPSVRPQSGLSFADLVFEYYIGEGANRFMAVFYGKDAKKAGSVRSGRLVDAQLVKMYQGILAYGSADPQVDEFIEESLGPRAISNLESGCPSFCGSTDTHESPWIYANTFEISAYANRKNIDNTRTPLNGMVFDEEPPSSDQYGIKLGVEYGFARGEWRFDPQSGQYLRWEERKLSPKDLVPLIDRLNNQQLSFSNVAILFARYTEFAPTLHDIDIWDNSTGQRAVFFRDGLMIDGTWRTVDKNQPIQFFNQFGLPLTLKPGNTWIVLAGLGSQFDQVEFGHWEMHFHLP